MPDYVLSNRADSDPTDIYLYSFRGFGEGKADAYVAGLSERLQRLADSPRLGRPAEIRPDLLRYRYGRHLIFYRTEATGIFVVRILHEAMDFPRHFGPADDDER